MKHKVFVGIDQSLASTGVVFLKDDSVLDIGIYSFPEKKNYEHYWDMINIFDEIYEGMPIGTYDVTAVGFEGYSFASKGNTLTRLVELGTMIRYIAAQNSPTPTYIFAPQNLKKFVAGKTFKKDEMRLQVYKRWGFEHKSNDVVDAYAIARYTQAIYSHLNNIEQKLTAFQTQAIESWLKNKNGVHVNEQRSNG